MQLQCIFSSATAQKLKVTTKGCGHVVELHTPQHQVCGVPCSIHSVDRLEIGSGKRRIPLNNDLIVVMDS